MSWCFKLGAVKTQRVLLVPVVIALRCVKERF